MREVGKEIKSYTELNGRYDSNLIDTLTALYNYKLTKRNIVDHLQSKELVFLPTKQDTVEQYSQVLNEKAQSKIEGIKQNSYDNIGQTQIPDYAKKLKTISTIPAHLQQAFPSKISFMVDKTQAEKETNPSHERLQKIKFKREVENSIQQVADINQKEQPMEVDDQIIQINTQQSQLPREDLWQQKAGKIVNNDLDSIFMS